MRNNQTYINKSKILVMDMAYDENLNEVLREFSFAEEKETDGGFIDRQQFTLESFKDYKKEKYYNKIKHLQKLLKSYKEDYVWWYMP